jgi:hypothetical protein
MIAHVLNHAYNDAGKRLESTGNNMRASIVLPIADWPGQADRASNSSITTTRGAPARSCWLK